ncbi:hypothetical protein VN12_18790 [Pirellula sp. SH-Sr6A]|uniref:hypothetical protein n=1 Tax=Pirellula sp. SH-Sr6A TaxID=1632865 RepID=UPI00078D6A19|nr:hypothetical protein [Pirellula sp. SH-Sr6A]AMV34184.1 hypothetical protein VN12_18790 [Pirellula sp. SH-Sr6A]
MSTVRSTDVYGTLNYDPTKALAAVMGFAVRLNNLGNLTRADGEVLDHPSVEGLQGSYWSQVTRLGDTTDSDDTGFNKRSIGPRS